MAHPAPAHSGSATLSHSSLNVHGVMMKKYCPHVSESVKFDVIVCVFAAVKHGTAEYCGLSWPCPVSTVWSWSIQRSQLAPAELYNEQLHSDTPESSCWAHWSSWMCTICTASVYKNSAAAQQQHKHWTQERERHPSIRQWEKSHSFKSTLFYKLVIFQIKFIFYRFILFKSLGEWVILCKETMKHEYVGTRRIIQGEIMHEHGSLTKTRDRKV